tara:strand:+ start:169 stop:345 length:177 start_codon:yes stop_codon:yes gene_type:complete
MTDIEIIITSVFISWLIITPNWKRWFRRLTICYKRAANDYGTDLAYDELKNWKEFKDE